MQGFSLLLFWGCCVIGEMPMHAVYSLTPTTRDVNECADTTACPAYAKCTDTKDSYYCTCKRGFLASNGQSQFRGPGLKCIDIDECSQNPLQCGPNSICKNLLGRYKCSCTPGFSSPTGNNWILGQAGNFTCTDINECNTNGTCPEHSNCVNSVGSYSCECQDGFTSINSTCEDVDECANPNVCPEHTICINTLGNHFCNCSTGFESSSGEQCEDVDECSRNSTLCGPDSVCLNIPGAYRCSCLPGFFMPDFSTPEHPDTFKCTDIDECTDIEMCPINAACTNTPGSYFCTCHPGFVASKGQLNFTDKGVKCRDIDECLKDPSPCGSNSICTNAPGSYSCSCTVGFRPNPEGSAKHGNFSCKRVPFKCKEDVIPNNLQVQQCQKGAAVELKNVPFCGLINATFGVLDDTCENKTTVVSLESTAKTFVSVLQQAPTWSTFTKEETSTLATVVLESVESITLAAFLKPSENASQTIQTEYFDIERKVINEECIEENVTFNLKAKGDGMKVKCSTIKESESTGMTGVAFVSFEGMASALDERFFQDPQAPLENFRRKLRMNSRVVGGIMTGDKKDNFSHGVIYILQHTQPKQKFEKAICVSWSSGRWTHSGCVIRKSSRHQTECICKHLANLAVIMASGELTMELPLYIISHVGMIISLVCLVLAIATFLLCHSIRNNTTYIHLHLCVCLFLAKILFLVGIDKTDNQVCIPHEGKIFDQFTSYNHSRPNMGCAIIAGVLHYLFLACFFWMLVEAVMLFLMVRNLKVVNYFGTRNIKMPYLCAFGYGLPGLVVVISASMQPQGYGMHDRCWLNTETGFIWSFLGPVCAIIMINSILLSWTLWILRQRLCSVNEEVSKLKNTRLLTFKAFAQIFILGCTWVLGILQIGSMAGVIAYLFTIINSLQGAFIFLIHCLLNRQVREEYRRWITRKTKPSSKSQTSEILLSPMPSTSKTG